jgi:hypothetical protein
LLCHPHLVAHLAFGVLHHDPALGAFHEHDERNDAANKKEQQKLDEAELPLTAKFLKNAGNRTRQLRNDTGEDNQRNTVTDTALR